MNFAKDLSSEGLIEKYPKQLLKEKLKYV